MSLREAKVPNAKAVLSVSPWRTEIRAAPRAQHRALSNAIPCAHIGCILSFEMRVIARRTLREFVVSRAGYRDQLALKAALDAWFVEVRKARWSSTADIKRLYESASIVSGDRIVFNIKGNAYRLVIAVDFAKGIIWIKWLGTHRDYDRIDVKEVDLE